MDYIKGYTFGFCAPKGSFRKEKSKKSLLEMKKRTGSTHVLFVLAALQETAQSTQIDFTGSHMVDNDELIEMIEYSKTLGLIPILKPLVNCRNGTWRAHISFFEKDVPCEPKWSEWFESYTTYQVHYAKIAQALGCEMFIVGCEMVQTNHRAEQWRALIQEVRKHYSGLVSYNCDKYQEDQISWWDAVDVISASGYYPVNDWDAQLERIYQVLQTYNKPFFFAEAGCMSTRGSQNTPNDWSLKGVLDLGEQALYYKRMFAVTKQYPWIRGFGLWDWSHYLPSMSLARKDRYYATYGKPAEEVIYEHYTNTSPSI